MTWTNNTTQGIFTAVDVSDILYCFPCTPSSMILELTSQENCHINKTDHQTTDEHRQIILYYSNCLVSKASLSKLVNIYENHFLVESVSLLYSLPYFIAIMKYWQLLTNRITWRKPNQSHYYKSSYVNVVVEKVLVCGYENTFLTISLFLLLLLSLY